MVGTWRGKSYELSKHEFGQPWAHDQVSPKKMWQNPSKTSGSMDISWTNWWQTPSKSSRSVASQQGTRIDAAVSKSASLKKQVAGRLSGQFLEPVTCLDVLYHRIPWVVPNSWRIFLRIYNQNHWKSMNQWTSNCVLMPFVTIFVSPRKEAYKEAQELANQEQHVLLGHHQIGAGWFGRDAGHDADFPGIIP